MFRGSYGVIYTGKVKGIEEKIVIKDLPTKSHNSVHFWKREISNMVYFFFIFYSFYYRDGSNSPFLITVTDQIPHFLAK